jgi:hypothetical protein
MPAVNTFILLAQVIELVYDGIRRLMRLPERKKFEFGTPNDNNRTESPKALGGPVSRADYGCVWRKLLAWSAAVPRRRKRSS